MALALCVARRLLFNHRDGGRRRGCSLFDRGGCRRGRDDSLEVLRILKAFVDAQWLAEFDARLAAYRAQLEAPGREE